MVDAYFWSYPVELQNVTSDHPWIASLVFLATSPWHFTSREFKWFLKANCVKHIWSVSYHPSSNGAANCFYPNLEASSERSNSIWPNKTNLNILNDAIIKTMSKLLIYKYSPIPHTPTFTKLVVMILE